MRKNVLWHILLIASLLVACKGDNNISNKSDSSSESGATYAELSIAQGGQWEGRVYKGRTSFKNIERLSVPKEQTDHSYFIRYEGPGWESDKVGYRLYLDWRNAIDVFGKKTEDIVLSQVGQDGFDSYHEISDWGMDVLKVGKALGLGSYGRLLQDSVHHFQNLDSTSIFLENTSKYSSVNIQYYGWQTENFKTNLSTKLSIEPNSRLTKVELSDFTTAEGMVTGIVKLPGTELFDGDKSKKWNYLATYGKQSLLPDELGMVIFYKNDDVLKTVEGKYDHLIQFKSEQNNIEYYFAAAWCQEKHGIKSKEEFNSYIIDILEGLNK